MSVIGLILLSVLVVSGTIIILGGSSAQTQSTTTQKTLTIIIKYDENKMVRDFAYNFTQF